MMNPDQLRQIMANAQQMQNLQQQFQQYSGQFQGMANGGGMPGPGTVQQMMNNGTMSQQEFEQCRQMANWIMGRNY